MPALPSNVTGSLRSVADAALEVAVPVSFSRLGYAARRALWGWDAPTAGAAGRTIVVTGATSGLGYETARELLAAGATVEIVARDPARGATAARRLAVETGADAPLVRLADLGDLDAVRALADELVASHETIDGLVHNAGAMPTHRVITGDGLESAWASMVTGPHLLTRSLGDRLARATVVFVTSGGMYTQRLPLDDPTYADGAFKGAVAYSRAKRAQVDLVAEYERRMLPGPAATVVAVHPGWADTPGVVESLPTFHQVMGPLLRSPSQGVDTAVWAVGGADRLDGGRLYFDRRVRGVSRWPGTATSDADRAALWDLVERQAGLT